jgi:hypothetical protein
MILDFDERQLASTQKRRSRFIIVMAVFIITAFYAGYRLGKEVERQEWLEIVNEKVAK